MSDFNFQPAYNASVVKAPRILAAQFGDGYEQRIADGINTTPQIWQLNFQAVKAEIDAIDAFLSAKAGIQSFTWTPEGKPEIRVKCSDWTLAIIAPNVGTISAKFAQVFES